MPHRRLPQNSLLPKKHKVAPLRCLNKTLTLPSKRKGKSSKKRRRKKSQKSKNLKKRSRNKAGSVHFSAEERSE